MTTVKQFDCKNVTDSDILLMMQKFYQNHICNPAGTNDYNLCQKQAVAALQTKINQSFADLQKQNEMITFQYTVRNNLYTLFSSFVVILLICGILFMTKIIKHIGFLAFVVVGSLIVLYTIYAIHYQHQYANLKNQANVSFTGLEYWPETILRAFLAIMVNENCNNKKNTTENQQKPNQCKPYSGDCYDFELSM